MQTTGDFHQAVLDTFKAMAAAVADMEPAYDWDTVAEPLVKMIERNVLDGIDLNREFPPLVISSYDSGAKEAREAMLKIEVRLFEDADDCVHRREYVPMSDVILRLYDDCSQSTLQTIAAIERSCAIARERIGP